MPRLCITFSLLAILWTVAALPAQAEAEAREEILLDRLVAVVDEDPILLSDILRTIGLRLAEPEPSESEAQLQRRVLDGLIDQTLRLHEVERHDFSQLPSSEIDSQVARIAANFDDGELRRRLAELGLDDEGLRLLITRQLRVLVYIERRLGPRVFIKPGDVRTYYDEVLVAEMAGRGVEAPAFDTVREPIRDLLREQRLNQEIEAWTEELRQEAEIEDYLDRSIGELPPIVQRLE
ncbi:MAG: hypothetical protein AAF657_24900 [Acidobacteriota bacterium]